MPSSPLNFRTVCGQFVSVFVNFMSKRAKKSHAAMKTVTLKIRTRADGVMAGLLLSFFYLGHLLILSGDIELNPGPPKTSCTKQTKLTSGKKARGCDNTLPEPSPTTESTSSGPTLRDIMDLLSSMNDSWSQPLHITDPEENNQPAATTIRDIPISEEPADNDLMTVINNINCKFEEMRTNLSKLTNICSTIQNEISNLKEEMTALKNEHEDVKKENTLLRDKIDTFEKKTDKLEFQSKRNNCVFHGIFRKNNETRQECEQAVRKLVTEKLGISEPIQFEKIYRVNNKSDSPIIASFTFHQQKEIVLKARRKLQGSNVFVSDDFPVRIREIRRNLVPFLKEAKAANKKAFMIYDYLIIEGRKFYLSQDCLQERE